MQSETDGLNNKIRAEKETIRLEIEAEINRLSQSIADSERTIQTIESDFVNQQKSLHSEYLSRKGTLQSDTENTIIAINTQIESEKSLFKAEKSRIEQQLKTELGRWKEIIIQNNQEKWSKTISPTMAFGQQTDNTSSLLFYLPLLLFHIFFLLI